MIEVVSFAALLICVSALVYVVIKTRRHRKTKQAQEPCPRPAAHYSMESDYYPIPEKYKVASTEEHDALTGAIIGGATGGGQGAVIGAMVGGVTGGIIGGVISSSSMDYPDSASREFSGFDGGSSGGAGASGSWSSSSCETPSDSSSSCDSGYSSGSDSSSSCDSGSSADSSF